MGWQVVTGIIETTRSCRQILRRIYEIRLANGCAIRDSETSSSEVGENDSVDVVMARIWTYKRLKAQQPLRCA